MLRGVLDSSQWLSVNEVGIAHSREITSEPDQSKDLNSSVLCPVNCRGRNKMFGGRRKSPDLSGAPLPIPSIV